MPVVSPATGARVAGLVAGIAVVVSTAALSWRVEPTRGVSGLSAQLTVQPSGEVGTAPAGRVLSGAQLVPGGPAAAGTVRLRNQTAQTILARPAVTGGDPSVDDALLLELRSGGRRVFRATVADVRAGRAPGLAIARGETMRATLRLSVRPGDDDSTAARSTALTLTFAGAAGR